MTDRGYRVAAILGLLVLLLAMAIVGGIEAGTPPLPNQ